MNTTSFRGTLLAIVVAGVGLVACEHHLENTSSRGTQVAQAEPMAGDAGVPRAPGGNGPGTNGPGPGSNGHGVPRPGPIVTPNNPKSPGAPIVPAPAPTPGAPTTPGPTPAPPPSH